MEPDTNASLASIRANYKAPIFTELLRIQNYRQEKPIRWIQHLQCLRRIDRHSIFPKERRRRGNVSAAKQAEMFLERQMINPLHEYHRDYVAVSYTWEESSQSDMPAAIHEYCVQSRDKLAFIASKVRDGVLARVIKYVEYRGIELFWIDQECIEQTDSEEKQAAMQSMDQVYSLSKFPVGLLSVHIESGEHMDNSTTEGTVDLLTSDKWWSRAWIYQEDYLSSVNMVLLIPHNPSLEDRKQGAGCNLGKLPGELCVGSANFREEATKFCLAYKKAKIPQWQADICKTILQSAGKYTVLLREPDGNGDNVVCKSMSPLILADIGKRDITEHSDLLAIAANCCGYSNRLITTDLKTIKCSLSLSILTLYLLNGEIIFNDQMVSKGTLPNNIFDFLKKQSLDNFDPPVVDKQLTFIKGCRLPSVILLKEGIKTAGQLWKLGKVVETRKFPSRLPWERSPDYGLGLYQRRRLRQLVNELASGKHGKKYKTLARDINKFLHEDAALEDDADFVKQYKDLMAEVLVQAIDDGKKLRLALPILQKGQAQRMHRPYRGIFIADSSEILNDKWQSYVFTASKYSRHTTNYVSLEVNWNGSTSSGLPRVITRRWINGLCFDRYPPVDVVFPWPASLAS